MTSTRRARWIAAPLWLRIVTAIAIMLGIWALMGGFHAHYAWM